MSGVKERTPVAIAPGDERGRDPAPVFQFFAPLGVDDKMFSGIRRGKLFQRPGAGLVKFQLDGKSPRRGDQGCLQ